MVERSFTEPDEYDLFMRCLIMASASLDLGVLHEVLADLHAESESTSILGPGVDLLRVPLEDFDFGIAIIPDDAAENSGVRAAIFLEIGIAAARNLPVLVITSPDEPPLPALGDLVQVRTRIDNADALRLHIGLFLAPLSRDASTSALWKFYDVQRADRSADEIKRLWNEEAIKAELDRVFRRNSRQEYTESQIATYIEKMLQSQGALVQREARGESGAIELAFTHPGIRETVLVEIKKFGGEEGSLDGARRQLSKYMRNNSQSIGLILFDELPGASTPNFSPDYPQILALSLMDFVASVEPDRLGSFLAHTRNQLVHGQ
ncbi:MULTISPECIES: hypothetical protein [unclassified Nocardia]|uniref:hypothetical protein n=1 Tax=unclassified Nocardia TaxID=2637762 RepID=UPI001CE49EAE|nr:MULTISPECIES: hypothetical protein [unclassified Nocardia]